MIDFIKQHHSIFNLNYFVLDALKEDIGDGDHTSLAIIPKTKKGKMQLLVKENGIIAGVFAAQKIFKLIDKNIKLSICIRDGEIVSKGDIIFIVEGNIQKLLTAERLILNIMQRMSGIATKTFFLKNLCKGSKALLLDTRKTTPGFRFFEKWAVIIGGGINHRFGLFDKILIKDNHIDFAGGINQAIDKAKKYLKENKKNLDIEIEVRTLDDVKEVLAHGGIQRIMLDNFSPMQTKHAVNLINGLYEVESSGGISEKNINLYARCGVDYISVGSLTHNIKSLDLSLKAIK